MITVTAETKKFGEARKIVRITAEGHSGYAKAGRDIVCAAVSSSFEFMINSITEAFALSGSCDVTAKPEIPFIELRLDRFYSSARDARDEYIVSKLAGGFIDHVKNIESQFGGYIKIRMKDL